MTEGPARSLWADTLPDTEVVRPTAPSGSIDADVIIVGAGFTGLWTAWYLIGRDPTMRITIVEREHIGFGASGRNGGWCSALLPMGLDRIADRAGSATAARFQRAMHETVYEIASFVTDRADSSILHRGGTIDVARSEPQRVRLRHEIETYRRHGFDENDYRWLDAAEAAAMCSATHALGATYTPHCATVHPLRLTHALARAVLDAGVEIVEGVDVHAIRERELVTSHGTFDAELILRATEGYTPRLDGERRSVLPLYSLMIATETLPPEIWDEIGLADRPTFADGRNLIIYGQRTADDRIAFGGRGAPYHFASRIRPEYDTNEAIRESLIAALHDLFPVTRDVAITHHWGGVLGVPRDWHSSVRFDRRTGLGSAGGYVGDGVATTNLAGRTLAALILGDDADAEGGGGDGRDRDLLTLPWVGHRSRRWAPEPFRWLGVNGGRAAARRADLAEAKTGRRSRIWGGVLNLIR